MRCVASTARGTLQKRKRVRAENVNSRLHRDAVHPLGGDTFMIFLWSGQGPLSGWATDRPKNLTLSREKQDVTARGKPLLIDDE